MNRVHKKFLKKLSILAAIGSYCISSMIVPGFLTQYLGYGFDMGVAIGVTVFIFLPIISYIILDMYQDAKREVEQENVKMIRTLKGKKQ